MKVSLYIPCFNAERTIKQCLEAVFKQTYPLKEVMVIDDGSGDQTVKIASHYPVKIIMHKNNLGLAAARNTAIKEAKGEFISSLDADCVPQPDWLMKLVKRFKSLGTAGVGGRLLEKHSTVVFDRWRSVHMKQEWGGKKTSPAFLFGSNTVFRKEALVGIGLYNENFKTNYEDVDISRRLRKKGWVLTYEPEAIAYHLKDDNVSSILNTYWRWNAAYYQKKGFYADTKSFIFKIKDNLGLANRYLEEDINCKRDDLVYLDFLLALHHSLRDFEYFIFRNKRKYPDYSMLSFWLSLVDLTFFYHFDSKRSSLSTLLPKRSLFLQNFFALNLTLGECVWQRFKDNGFRIRLCKDLLLSVYRMDDSRLLDKLLNLVSLHPDWSDFIKKKHQNLNTVFLKNLLFYLEAWLKQISFRFPNIIRMIELSAEKN